MPKRLTPNRLLRRLLRRLGLELRTTSAALRVDLARADERLNQARRRKKQYRSEALHWKNKCGVLVEREATLKARQQAREQVMQESKRMFHERERAVLHKARAEFEHKLAKLRQRDQAHIVRMEALRKRIEDAERSVQKGRECMSVLEVKLDLVDGAINTLDRRYRTVATQFESSGE